MKWLRAWVTEFLHNWTLETLSISHGHVAVISNIVCSKGVIPDGTEVCILHTYKNSFGNYVSHVRVHLWTGDGYHIINNRCLEFIPKK